MKKQFSLKYFLTLLLCVQFAFAPISVAYADNGTVVDLHDDGDKIVENDDFLMSGLLMLTMPIIGVMSVKSIVQSGTCYSPWVFNAAAIYYGVMEVINWENFEEGQDVALKILQGKDKDLQLQDLQDAKDMTSRAKEAVEQKVSNTQTAAIGFGIASAVALAEWIANTSTMFAGSWAVGCKPRNNTNEKAIDKNWKGGQLLDKAPNQYASSFDYLFNNKLDLQVAQTRFTPYNNGSSMDQLIQLIEDKNLDHSFKITDYEALKKSPVSALLPSSLAMRKWLKNTSELLFPSANATMTNPEQVGIITGSIAAGVIAMLTMTTDQEYMASMFNDWARAAWYAGATGVALMAAQEFEDVVKDLEEREQKYDSLIKALQKTNQMSTMDMQGSIKNANIEQAPVIQDPLKAKEDGNNDLCMSGTSGQMKPISCKRCNATNTCKKSEIPANTQFPATMPRELAQATNLMQQMQNARYSGNTSQANLAETQLGQYASRIRKINKQLQELANKDRIASGKKPIDFERMSKALMKRYKKTAIAAINSLPASKRDTLMALSGAKNIPHNKDKKIASNNSQKSALAATGGQDGKEGKKDPFAGLDFGLEEEQPVEAAKPALGANEEYDYGEKKEDIVQTKDTNLFQVITVRYLKSAYPILLEEVE